MSRLAIGLALAHVALLTPAASAEAPQDLYETVTIVTGQREETRLPGVRRCFLDVLEKVSGDQTLMKDSALDDLAGRTDTFVANFRYHDRLWKRPIHDEQGTRDRPYDLTVDFDRGKIDAALRTLGREPWIDNRPHVAAFVAVRQGDTSYLTSTDGAHGYGQADAFADAATRTGVPVVVPSQRDLDRLRLSEVAVGAADPAELQNAAAAIGAVLPLVGTMTFSDADAGWAVEWRFAWRGAVHRWQVKGVNFDAAFLNGMRGVAQIASGHGSP